MRITWKDAYARGFTAEVSALLPGGTDLCDELIEDFDLDLIEVYGDEADGEGVLSVEFYCLEPVDPNDESPVEPEVDFGINIAGKFDNCDEAVALCKAVRLSYTVEECTTEFRGEPLTYFKYKATYGWHAIGVIEG
jgi:hypothetical protein